VSGAIEALGPDVEGWQVGEHVCAILTGGGYAELCLAPVQQVLRVPDRWSLIEAATLPENLFTVFDNLVTRAGLRLGETVLVHGGTSGIGSMAIMLGRAVRADVLATAGSAAKCEACLSFGARAAINYKEFDFLSEVNRLTDGRGSDVILDMVGGPYLARNLKALAREGRLTIVATQGGRSAELDLGELMMKRCRVLGSTMRARTAEEKGRVVCAVFEQVWPLLPPKDTIRPLIDATFPLSDASSAHQRMEEGSHIGKIVLVNPNA
jgi:putative PIG3 family NAD(P)H quinone oxidoreductase